MNITHVNLAKGFRGGERQTELLIRALQRAGVNQTAVVRSGSPLNERLSTLPGLRLITAPQPYLFTIRELDKTSLLHAHEAKAGQFAFLAHLFIGTPYLITRRVPQVPKNNFFTRGVYRQAHALVALSSAIRGVLETYDTTLKPDTIPSMAAGFHASPEHVEAIKDRYQGKFLVGHIGALVTRHKGQQYLVEAAKKLASQAPEMHFLFLGKGNDEAILRAMAKDLPSVEFLGFQHNVADYLAAFDLFAFPSLNEGLGSTLLDAMEAGKPIVASQVDGIPDIVHHDVNGLLVPPGDSDALANALYQLYNAPEKRLSLAQKGLEMVADYQPDKIAARYFDLYCQLREKTQAQG
ncbi:MAG: glycosyltransferase family 4 protein [Gammaproteobacteria bacterium]|nr:glycosyltransferase family 4 protein [Gammaproteobacteria bacterium]